MESPPTGECIKVNVDAAELHNVYVAGFGLIARDSAGFVLGVKWMRSFRQHDSPSMEASAVRFGVLFALEMGFLDVVIESDSANVVRALHRKEGSFFFSVWPKGLEAVEKEPMPIVRVRRERAVHLDV